MAEDPGPILGTGLHVDPAKEARCLPESTHLSRKQQTVVDHLLVACRSNEIVLGRWACFFLRSQLSLLETPHWRCLGCRGIASPCLGLSHSDTC